MNGYKKSSVIARKTKDKPDWDATVSDLNAYKLTPEELLQRKIDHLSKNQQINFSNAQIIPKKPETVYDRLSKVRYGNQIKDNEVNQRRKIVKEMFTSDKELFDLFEQSEKSLSAVESMFGDPLKRYKVNPSVTPAPNFSAKVNTNNSNSCALNEFSDSEMESSKSEIKLTSIQSHNDDLSRFKKFIENERKTEESLENCRKKVVNGKNAPNIQDASTETIEIDESKNILQYICSRLLDSNCPNYLISNCNKDFTDKIVNHIVNINRKNAIQIEQLNGEIIKSKELIDALTLELINNNEKMKLMKNEYEMFTKKVTTEISEMKSLIIKYLDQKVFSDSKQIPGCIYNLSAHSVNPRSKELLNFDSDINCFNNEEVLLHNQINSLQLEHLQTEKRLKNLLKIQDSISQVSES